MTDVMDKPPEAAIYPGVDALLPEAMAAKSEETGLKKAKRGGAEQIALAVLAGAFVALGGLFATVTMSGDPTLLPYGVTRLLGGVAFSLGLLLVMLAGAQLFTGDALMVMAWASRKLSTARMLKVWALVWCGNFIGSVGTALLVFLSGQYMSGHGAVGATALYYAVSKAGVATGQAFFLGILCNVLVCLAVWLTFGARSFTDKVMAVVFPITAFVAAGFEHCVANMYFIPLGLMIKHGAPDSFWESIHQTAGDTAIPVGHALINLAAVTAGNVVGGAVFVGAVYWFIYLRPRPEA
jgi:formate transporter